MRFAPVYAGGFAFWLASLYWLLLIPYAFFPILGWLALAAFLALLQGCGHGGFRFQVSGFRLGLDVGFGLWESGGMGCAGNVAGADIWGISVELSRLVSSNQLVPLIQIASVTGVMECHFWWCGLQLALFCAGWMIWNNPSQRFVWQAEIALPLIVVIACFTGGIF